MVFWCSMYGVAVAATEAPTPPPAQPFVSMIDWQLVTILAGFGLLGALPRIDPISPLHPKIWQQLSSGVVGGLTAGLWCADVEWFQSAPRTLLVVSIVAGYAGTAFLDAAATRLRGQAIDDRGNGHA